MDKYLIALDCAYQIILNPQDDEGEFSPVQEIFAQIKITDYKTEEFTDELAGYLHLHYYNVGYAINHGYSIYAAFDRSMNTIEMGDTILYRYSNQIRSNIEDQLAGPALNLNILVIQDFRLYPKFRGKGIGKLVLQGLKDKFTEACGYIFLKSFPIQCEAHVKSDPSRLVDDMQLILFEQDKRKAQIKLNRYYKQCGFIKLKGTDNYFGFTMS